MDQPDFTGHFLNQPEEGKQFHALSDLRIAIWGLGLMGGSLAMALKGKCRALLGIDSDPETVALALEWGIVDAANTRAEPILGQADLIVLATPVRTILALLEQLPRRCPGPAIVIDLGSTKAQIVEAMRALPERFDPLGGHPMCGKEKSTLRAAEASVYQNAPFALVMLERTSSQARRLGEELVKAAGACPLLIDANVHDRWVAATSHVPFLISSALAQATPPEAAPLVGSGFRSAARLAGSSPKMMGDILATNKDNVLAALRACQTWLDEYQRLLEQGDFERLAEAFRQGGEQYRELIG